MSNARNTRQVSARSKYSARSVSCPQVSNQGFDFSLQKQRIDPVKLEPKMDAKVLPRSVLVVMMIIGLVDWWTVVPIGERQIRRIRGCPNRG